MTQMPSELALQPRVRRLLERIEAGEGGHAFMLTGAAGNGPLAAAQWLAARLLAPSDASSQVAADVARRVARRVHPDLIWIHAEGAQLANQDIDRVIDQVSRTPFEASTQVVVIEDAGTLGATNPWTANRLLRTLEEPAGSVVFLLLVERADFVLPTIRSRAAEIYFGPIADADARRLVAEVVAVAPLSAPAHTVDHQQLARIGSGDIARLRELAAGGDAWLRYRGIVDGMLELVSGRLDPSALAAWVMERAAVRGQAVEQATTIEFEALRETMAPDERRSFSAKSNDQGMEKRTKRRVRRARRDELIATLRDAERLWRDLMVVASGADDRMLLCADRVAEIHALAGSHAALRAVAGIDAIEETVDWLRGAADDGLAIDALFTELGGLARGRIRARRTLGAPARTSTGVAVDLG